MKSVRLVLLLLLFSGTKGSVAVWGQINSVEFGAKTPSDTKQVQQLIDRALFLRAHNEGDSALLLLQEALSLSARLHYQPGIDTALSQLILGIKALEHTPFYGNIMQQALHSIKNSKVNHKKRSYLTRLYGQALHRNEQYNAAMKQYNIALQLLQTDTSTEARKQKADLYRRIAVACLAINRPDRARKWLGAAERMVYALQDPKEQFQNYEIKGAIFYKVQDTDSAYHYINRAYEIGKQLKVEDTLPCTCLVYSTIHLSVLLIDKKRPLQALTVLNEEFPMLDRVIRLKQQEGYRHVQLYRNYTNFNFLKAYAYYQLQHYDSATHLALTVLDSTGKRAGSELKGDIYELLSMIYAKQQNFQQAYHYKNLRSDLERKNMETIKNQILSEQYAAEKNNAVAEKQLQINRQSSRLREKNILITAATTGLLLLAIALAFMWRSNRNKQKLQASNLQNLQHQQEIKELQARMEGQEQERKRIAHELHDGVASQLLALRLHINSLQDKDEEHIRSYQLNDIAIQLQEATNDLRHTAHNLMPDLLLQQGLSLSVAALCEKTNQNTPLEVDFQAWGHVPKLSPEVELNIYRMVQELIQNALKHAQATQLLVQLGCRDDSINITVEDDGIGFPVAILDQDKQAGIGLRHLKQRVNMFDGLLDIKSNTGAGTNIYIEFNLSKLAKA